jgi:hypothetical protein
MVGCICMTGLLFSLFVCNHIVILYLVWCTYPAGMTDNQC